MFRILKIKIPVLTTDKLRVILEKVHTNNAIRLKVRVRTHIQHIHFLHEKKKNQDQKETHARVVLVSAVRLDNWFCQKGHPTKNLC